MEDGEQLALTDADALLRELPRVPQALRRLLRSVFPFRKKGSVCVQQGEQAGSQEAACSGWNRNPSLS